MSGMAEATAFKYGVRMDYEDQCQKCKLWDKGPVA